MKLFLLLVLVLILGFQDSQSKFLNYENDNLNSIEFFNTDNYRDRNQRDLSASWHKIKNDQAIRNAWDSFKNVVKKINEEVQHWTQKIKEKVLILTKIFEKRLDSLRNEFKAIIEDAIITGDSVRNCLEGDKDVIEAMLKEIFINVTTCISTHVNIVEKIENLHKINNDDSEHFNDVQNIRMNACEKDCSNYIKDKITIKLQNLKWEVSRKAFDAKNVIDESLDLIVKCVAEGLLKASSSITDETVKIVKCVKNQT